MLKQQPKRSIKVVREHPEYHFIWDLFKITGKLPDDPFYENINPYLRMLLFECWLYEKEFEAERMTNQAILIGSFHNPEAAQKMVKSNKPDFVSSSDDFEKVSQLIHEQAVKDEKKKRRKVVR